MRSFEDLEVWKRGCRLAVFVCQRLKDSRDFALADQMRRAAISIPSNIAEGHERPTADFARFVAYAQGSLAELRTQAYIAAEVGTLTSDDRHHIVEESRHIARMLSRLHQNLLATLPEHKRQQPTGKPR